MAVCGPVRVSNKANIPRKGGVLLLANHLSDLDPVVVQMACPRPIYFMAKSELFEMGFLSRVICFFRAFPVKRGEPDRDSIKKAVRLIQAGQAVCVFPEGLISETGELLELKSGVALIARMAKCPTIGCRLQNTQLVMPYAQTKPRRSGSNVFAIWSEALPPQTHGSAEEYMEWVRVQLTPPTIEPPNSPDAKKP